MNLDINNPNSQPNTQKVMEEFAQIAAKSARNFTEEVYRSNKAAERNALFANLALGAVIVVAAVAIILTPKN